MVYFINPLGLFLIPLNFKLLFAFYVMIIGKLAYEKTQILKLLNNKVKIVEKC